MLRGVREALNSAPKSRFWRYGTVGGGTKIAILALRNFWTTPYVQLFFPAMQHFTAFWFDDRDDV